MQLFEEKSRCFGCGVCETACRHNAISMEPDDEGFFYPVVDGARCVECGLCREVCPAGHAEGVEPPYGMSFSKENTGRSSSGGAFPALAEAFWDQHPGRPVWGACLTADMSIAHRYILSPAALSLLQGSKYVQSDMAEVYEQVLTQLRDGPVLFSGTPCQCAGLARLAKGFRERLVLVDLVCNGVASPAGWKRYLAMEVESTGQPVMDFDFRNKRYYMGRGIACTLMDGRVMERSHPEDLFSNCYQRNLISRSSCYRCPYTCTARVSDVTIGDFHGLEKLDPDFSSRGASLVLPHTALGEAMCQAISRTGKSKCFPTAQCLQPRLQSPPREIPLRKLILRDLLTQPTQVFVLKYGKMILPPQ